MLRDTFLALKVSNTLDVTSLGLNHRSFRMVVTRFARRGQISVCIVCSAPDKGCTESPEERKYYEMSKRT